MRYEFEWDADKAAANTGRHGVTFDEASTVFEDPLSLLMPDPDHSAGERRYVILGLSEQRRLLVVAFVERPPRTQSHICYRSRPEESMDKQRVFRMEFAGVYSLYVQKVEKKGRKRNEVDEVICWLTGYSRQALAAQIRQKKDFERFFNEAPSLHPNASKITGLICGVRVEEIDDPLMQKIRYLDKLVDELARGRPMEKILRK